LMRRRSRNDCERTGRSQEEHTFRLSSAPHGVLRARGDFRIGAGSQSCFTGARVLHDDCAGDNKDPFHRWMFVCRRRVPGWKLTKHPVFATCWISPKWHTLIRWKRLVILPLHFLVRPDLCRARRFRRRSALEDETTKHAYKRDPGEKRSAHGHLTKQTKK
jgi:hypothetical protein